jgi:hypothetical protein
MFSFKNNNFIPVLPTVRRNDNTSTILFTNARDEQNIAEWIAHHLLLVFDKVVVFDHLSKVPISSLFKTDFNGRLNIISVNGVGNIKINLMKDALEIASKGNYNWMLYLDADEFLNLNGFIGVKEYLCILFIVISTILSACCCSVNLFILCLYQCIAFAGSKVLHRLINVFNKQFTHFFGRKHTVS